MPFTTENNVRLRAQFHAEELFAEGEVIDTIELSKIAYNVILLVKNGDTTTPLVGGVDYTFQPPKTVKLTTIATAGDFYDVIYGTKISSIIIGKFLVDATSMVEAYLTSQFDSKMTAWETLDGVPVPTDLAGQPLAPALIQTFTADIAACYSVLSMMEKFHDYSEMAITNMIKRKDHAIKMLEKIQDTTIVLPDLDPPCLVGGRAVGDFVFADMPEVLGLDLTEEQDRLGLRGNRGVPRFTRGPGTTLGGGV